MKMKGYESIKLKKALTIEEAYQALSQAETPLGKPELYTVLGSTGIQFPPYKGYKVVMSVTRKAITISSTYDGAKGLAKEAGMDILSDGWSRIFGTKGENSSADAVSELANVCKRVFANYIA